MVLLTKCRFESDFMTQPDTHTQTWRDDILCGTMFRGFIADNDLFHNPTNELVDGIKREIVSQIAARIVDQLGPRIDAAIREAFPEPEEGL